MMRLAGVSLAVLLAAVCGWAEPAKECCEMSVVFTEDFEQGTTRWEMTDPQAWTVAEEGGNHVLALTKSSEYEPKVRSPKSIARVKALDLCCFVLDAQLKQTGREYGHRDLCLFFNYKDPEHFYYVHLATKADDHANSIFLVNGTPRVSIAKERTQGTDWGTTPHHVRIKRMAPTGRIEVYFDDMEKPVMVAEDRTLIGGTIGVGSFDDVGQFDDITVRGVKPCEASAKCPAKEGAACPMKAGGACCGKKPAEGATCPAAASK